MRRSSNAVLQTQTSEPLIVVDEGDNADMDAADGNSSDEDSPTMNPYLLSPWRDSREVRKHSLPTPQCSGITASQVRRLSERGEGSPGPRQAEFLATLSQAPGPSPGGRRHSVVTISKVPSTLFGRNRRESVATFPSSVFPGRILPNRRESIACPPSTESRGSVHNLQLDIMDDIVQARKVRMKLWNTSNEKVCEVQPLDEAGGVQRYTNSGRRYSDFVGTTLAPIPSSTNTFRKTTKEITSTKPKVSTGIVCTNTDLISILSSLTSSATEINKTESLETPKSTNNLNQKRSKLKGHRSNSFDISILHGVGNKLEKSTPSPGPSSWFTNRHQPISSKTTNTDFLKTSKPKNANKVVWDEKSGSMVDAEALGNAIEVFLRRSGEGETTEEALKTGAVPKIGTGLGRYGSGKGKTGWFSNKGEDESTEACDSSLCSTLKDLFVK